MTYKNLLSCLTLLFILPSCTGRSPNIVAVCEEDKVGNNVIKWEAPSRIKGKVKIYASTNPDRILPRNPIAIADISDHRLTIVTNDPVRRYYYLMVFDNRYRIKVAGRKIYVLGVQNLYDIGGYKLKGGKNVKWGKLYWAGEIDNLNHYALNKLKNTGIRTIVNLNNTVSEHKDNFLKKSGFNVISIPFHIIGNQICKDLKQKEIVNNDTIYQASDYIYCEFIAKHQSEYKRIFEILLDKTNYPVMFHCSSDRRCIAVISSLVLAALGVNAQSIMENYRSVNSNSTVSPRFAYYFPAKSRKTTMGTYEEFLKNFKKQIEKDYGNMNEYLEREIELTKDDIVQLKELLLE
jgi:protein-tyrosine phosphatase